MRYRKALRHCSVRRRAPIRHSVPRQHAFHQQFVQLMNAGAGTYASTEAANAKPLKTLEADISQKEATISQDITNISLQNRLISEAIAKLAQGDMRVLTDEELAREAELKSIHDAAFNAISSLVMQLAQNQKDHGIGPFGTPKDLKTIESATSHATPNARPVAHRFALCSAVGTLSVPGLLTKRRNHPQPANSQHPTWVILGDF